MPKPNRPLNKRLLSQKDLSDLRRMIGRNGRRRGLVDTDFDALTPSFPSSLRAHHPSVRERIGNVVYDTAKSVGLPAHRLRSGVDFALGEAPVVREVEGLREALHDIRRGDYGRAGLSGLATLIGAFPGPGRLGSKALQHIGKVPPAPGRGAYNKPDVGNGYGQTDRSSKSRRSGAAFVSRMAPALSESLEEECLKQLEIDERTCNGIRRSRGKRAAARCWATAMDRYGACLARRPRPILDTWNN